MRADSTVVTSGGRRGAGASPCRSHVMKWLALLLVVLFESEAHADALRATEDGLRREEQRLRDSERTESPSVLRPEAARPRPDVSDDDTPCFVARQIELQGTRTEHFAWLVDEALPYIGRCLGTRGLASLAAGMNESLVYRGFVTSRVTLPPQNLSAGSITVRVDAGMIESVRAQGAWSGTWENTVPVRAGDVLNARDLEQGVEQATRLPSAQLQTRIEAGETPDASVVILERSAARPWRLGATIDNSGNRATGEAVMQVIAAYDNPLGLSDMVSLLASSNLQDPSPRNRSQSASLDYSIPFGYGLLSAGYSRTRFGQITKGATQLFWSHGESETAQARYTQTLWRSGSARAGVFAGANGRTSHSYLEDVELLVQRRHTVNAELGGNWKHLFDAAALDVTVTFRKGVGWFDAQEDLAVAQAGGPTLRPRVTTIDADYSLPIAEFAPRLQWSSRLHAQTTPDITLSLDHIAIGGFGSVRGFDGESQLLGERGAYWRNELSWAKTFGAWSMVPYVAVDCGLVSGPSSPHNTRNVLAGAAIGLRTRWEAFRMDALLGVPLQYPEGFHTNTPAAFVSIGADL